MIQTSILRYITSDRQHLAAQNSNSILLRLPYDIRKKIYEYAGLSDGLVINLNYDYPSWLDEDVTACNSWNELIPPHTREREGRDQDLNREWDKVSADDGKVSDYEDEAEASESSQRISQFLDGPLSYPGARLYRVRPRCGELHYGEDDCEVYNRLLPSQLLDVCRVVSDEVKYLFYSKSHFKITSTHLGRFSGLVSLKPRVLSWLSSLSIRLCVCTCTTDIRGLGLRICFIHYFGQDRSKDLGIPGQEKLLQHAGVRYQSREITEWKLLCRHLALYITPHQLKLWVEIFALGLDIETAKDFTLAMMQLPVLRECGIYFMDKDCLEFQELARDTALKLTGRSSDALDSPFRFLDLPREIQLHILRYTNLVINNDIAWCPDSDYEGPKVFDASCLVWGEWNTDTEAYRYESKCCEKCADIKERCFCRSLDAAFSTSCTCWWMPMPLFVVSQQMREDATMIFFSLNNFLILPPRRSICQHLKYTQLLEILRFFSRFAARGRKHLRSVTWMLPELDHMWGPTEKGEWKQVVDICAEELSIERLVFTIDMSFPARLRRSAGLDYIDLPVDDAEEWEWLIGLFMVKSMARHKGWKHVYVHLSWPWHDSDDINDPYTSSGEAREIREEDEAYLEQMVMGPDNVAVGKYDRRHKWNGYHCTCKECGDENW